MGSKGTDKLHDGIGSIFGMDYADMLFGRGSHYPDNPYKGGMLTGDEIDQEVKNGRIFISRYNRKNLNPNSYNIRCGEQFTCYSPTVGFDLKDPSTYEKTETYPIDEEGVWFRPGTLYLVPSFEVIGSDTYIPLITGRSSMGRLGITVHQEAGFGDIGYKGVWTMQVKVSYPVKIYPKLPIAQVYFLTPVGRIGKLYNGKYQGSIDEVASRYNEDTEEK